jgi:hypothetical protein
MKINKAFRYELKPNGEAKLELVLIPIVLVVIGLSLVLYVRDWTRKR